MRVEEASYFADTLQAKTFLPSSGCVSNVHVAEAAGIATSKLKHRYRYIHAQGGTPATVTIPLAGVFADGTLNSIKAGLIAACTGDATITIDIKKNGSTVLTDVITLDDASTVRTLYAGTISDNDTEDGDWVELVVTATAGTGALGTGLLVQVEYDENAQ